MGTRLSQDVFQNIGLSCSSLGHLWFHRNVSDFGQCAMLFGFLKISSRLEPESKFMFFLVRYFKFAID